MRKTLSFAVMLMASLNFMFPCESAALELSTSGTIWLIPKGFFDSLAINLPFKIL